jgi:hypothetical protein
MVDEWTHEQLDALDALKNGQNTESPNWTDTDTPL